MNEIEINNVELEEHSLPIHITSEFVFVVYGPKHLTNSRYDLLHPETRGECAYMS